VLLGVNSDADRKELKEAMAKEELSWRTWWDGGSTEGPIATEWNIAAWPTMYVLDAGGVIRHKSVRAPVDETLDKLIENLVAEAEEKPARR
jgi:hypothetical protein